MKAAYLLSEEAFSEIYGAAERRAISSRVDISAGLITPQMYASSENAWPGVKALFSGWGMVRADKNFFDRFPDLEIIFYGAGSVRYFVTDELHQRDIAITVAQDANAIPVSEFTLSQILFSLKLGWRQVLFIKACRRYPDRIQPPGVCGSIVGLLSLGATGRLVANHLKRFEVSVIAFDPYISPEEASFLNVELASMEDVFSRSDVVSCHTPLLDATTGMIRGKHFNSMKQDATFINTARGAVVNEREMIASLRKRKDITAVLDVTSPEPPEENSELYTLDNVVLTPHLAGSLGAEINRMGRVMVEELDRYLAGKQLKYALNPEKAAILA